MALSGEHRPYVAAQLALREITETPGSVLRRLASDILRIPNTAEPGSAVPAEQLRLRVLVHELLGSIADDNDRIERAVR